MKILTKSHGCVYDTQILVSTCVAAKLLNTDKSSHQMSLNILLEDIGVCKITEIFIR